MENLHRLHVGLPQAARGGGVPGATQMPRAHSTRAPAHQLELVDANLPPLDLVGVDVLICLDFEATCDEGSAQLTVLLPVAGCRLPVAGCWLPVAGCRLPVAGGRWPVAGCLCLLGMIWLAASCRRNVAHVHERM